MTFREFQALVLLYGAAPQEARGRAALLVPELADFDDTPARAARRWRISATCDGLPLGEREVVCSEEDLAAAQEDFAREFPMARGVTTVVEALP